MLETWVDGQAGARHSIVSEPRRRPTRFLTAASIAIAIAAHAAPHAVAAPATTIPRDVLYSALHGEAEDVGADVLVTAPGRFVGRAVRTRGRLITVDAGASRYDLAVGKIRVILRLEPEAQAVVAARSSGWEGALPQPRDAGLQSVSPRISFAWPIPGESLRGRRHVVLQFSKPLDPQSLEGRVRVRYRGATTTAPAMTYEYNSATAPSSSRPSRRHRPTPMS